jgi:hypothetical protein
MKAILIVILILFSRNIFSQNILQNSDFEECESPCSGPVDQGDFYMVDKWGDFGSHNGTPDWWCGPYGYCYPYDQGDNGGSGSAAQSGTYYAGIFDDEGIYYNVGSQGFRTSIYRMSYWHDPSGFNQYADPPTGSSVYLTTIAPTNISCTNFAGGNKLKIYESSSDLTSWQKNQFIFSALNGPVIPFKYLVITGLRDGICDRYMKVDNTKVEDLCCGDFELYQNFPLAPDFSLPELTRRGSYIKAGYNVGAVHHAPGNVTVRSTEHVTFQAGDYIALHPGFIVEPGAVFKAEIKDCDNFGDNYGESPELLFHTNTAWFDCTGTADYNAGFASVGASYYRVSIYNRWGELVLDKMDFVNEVYTVYTDGADISSLAALNGVFTVVLELFNCNDAHSESFSLTYEYRSGCEPMSKREGLQVNKNALNESIPGYNSDIITIGPNPLKDFVNLSCSNNKLKTTLVVLNQLGNIALEQKIDFSFGDISIDMSKFSTGVYYFRTTDNVSLNNNRIVKCE